jgi:hypothetical protein
MSQSLLNKVWSFLVVVLLYLCLNVWSITQQWQLSLPGNPFKDGKTTPHGVALYGVLLCGPLLILVCVVTRLYSAHSLGAEWEDRFPRFGDFGLDTSKSEAKAFQMIALCLFLLIPLSGMVHFQNKMMTGSVFREQSPCPSAGKDCIAATASMSGWADMLFHGPRDVAKGRLVYDPDRKNDIAPTFVPFWEPWGLLTVSLFSVSFEIWCLATIFQPSIRKRHLSRRGKH